MAVQPNRTYSAVVIEAFGVISDARNRGLHLVFQTQDGDIAHDLWFSYKSAPFSLKTVADAFGITKEMIDDGKFMTGGGVIDQIRGDVVEITTIEEEYKGNTRVKVRFINSQRKSNTPATASEWAAVVGGVTSEWAAAVPMEEEVPF